LWPPSIVTPSPSVKTSSVNAAGNWQAGQTPPGAHPELLERLGLSVAKLSVAHSPHYLSHDREAVSVTEPPDVHR